MRVVYTALAAMTVGLAACGGGKSANNASGNASDTTAAAAPGTTAAAATPAAAPAAAPAGPMTVPAWMKVDKANKTVSLDIQAGKTADNNHWNFNGYDKGNATITVPEGYKVTIKFTNDDPAMAHSIGVDSAYTTFPAAFTNPQPIFPGAISSNPTDLTKATQPHKSQTITFTASKAGNYTINCFIPGHALSGMWVHFDVSSNGQAGVAASS
ncbi:MAG TPA: sulfocyanin-like copper-binding protein [Gemmatimonadaceae bacterium]|nr:sulfocyanin-like copper-binding protein [Gemmatimonadaceae bacterium]